MSEIIRHEHEHEHNEREADILPFKRRPEYLDEMTDTDVLDHFMSELRHPGVQGRLAEHILDYSGRKMRNDLNEERLAWRRRMQEISDEKREDPDIDTFTWELGNAVLENDGDAVINTIIEMLISTKEKSKDLGDERRALLALLDLRAAAVRRGMEDEETWLRVIDRLIGSRL